MYKYKSMCVNLLGQTTMQLIWAIRLHDLKIGYNDCDFFLSTC